MSENTKHNIIIDGSNPNEITEEQYNEIKDILHIDYILDTVNFDDSFNFYFLVPNYQRGYRWGKFEVEDLINDILEIKDGQKYCLQPIIVKKIDITKSKDKKLYEIVQKDKKFEQVQLENHPVGQEWFELIDGQQRLTSLFLLYKLLGEEGVKYRIFYENKRDIDFEFIEEASGTIENYFSPKTKEQKKKRKEEKVEEKIKKNRGNLNFIWYQVNKQEDLGQEIFSKINDGKIQLTNSELVKALILNPNNFKSDESNKQKEQIEFQRQIAYEWDLIENNLRNDSLWFFLFNGNLEEEGLTKNRIDYIIDLYAAINKVKEFDEKVDKFSFYVLNKKINIEDINENSRFEKIRNIWEGIIGIYNKILFLYNNNDIYHLLGYLISTSNRTKGSKIIYNEDLKEIIKEDKAIKDVLKYLENKIFELFFSTDNESKKINKRIYKQKDIDDLLKYNYDDYKEDKEINKLDKKFIYDFLLFTNIYPLLSEYERKSMKKNNDNEDKYRRFPFDLYKKGNYEIEHINPQKQQQSKDIIEALKAIGIVFEDVEEERTFFETLIENQQEDNSDVIKENKVESRQNKSLNSLKEDWDNLKDDYLPNHSISNLVLLNSKINHEYQNNIFWVKRRFVINYDEEGYFIPLTTKKVFLRYFQQKPKDLNGNEEFIYGEEDQGDYKKELESALECIYEWGNK